MKIRILALALLLGVLNVACAGRYLESPLISPETQIEDNEDTRALLELVESVQVALNDLDIASIRPHLSPRYYDNAGTTDTADDDYGLDGLLHQLETLKEHVSEVRLDIQVRDIIFDNHRGRAHVIYEFAYTMLYRVADQERWDTARDVNQLEFERGDDSWLIIRGL